MSIDKNRPVELLAPAGDWECARAAVENGADAIYFGLERFNARMRAKNFTTSDLPELMKYLHLRGVRGYVTFNTLVFENEIEAAREMIKDLAAAGVDAVIVQDIGLCRLIRETAAELPIHASTQMTITSAAGVSFAKSLGCNLVVLARECSLAEVEKIGTAAIAQGAELPLEIFVHGALCVAYSGQCLTSESLGGRSANRGECAQACRMPYDMIVDGKPFPLDERRYLLSPQDLSGVSLIEDIVKSGVVSLKIEGRLKSPLYVASVTRIYRQALDTALAGRQPKLSEEKNYELEMAFSRGLYTGWLGGLNNQQLVHARYPKKRGAFLGTVIEAGREEVKIELVGPVAPGDGVVFDSGDPQSEEEGGRVFDLATRGRITVLGFKNGSLDPRVIPVGARVYKTSDPQLDRELRKTFEGEAPRFKRRINVQVRGVVNQPLAVSISDEMGNQVQELSTMPLSLANARPLDRQIVEDKLCAFGDTPFELGQLSLSLDNGLFLPLAELKRLRRSLVEKLVQHRSKISSYEVSVLEPQSSATFGTISKPAGPVLSVLARTLDQVEAATAAGIGRVYLDFENVKRCKDGVRICRGAGVESFAAPPRIFKTGEEWILKQVANAEADGILARNFDHLRYFNGARIVSDFSFNIANRYSAQIARMEWGAERINPSYDLNVEQLLALFATVPPELFEVTIHQRMPMFHMEHCVFCAFLSTGKDYRDCGRPCDEHDLRLRDRTGSELLVKADTGCRNTVFNSKAQTAAEFLDRFVAAGCRYFRVDMVDESAQTAAELINRYQALLRGETSGIALWRELKLISQLGVTRGQLGNSGLPIFGQSD